MTRDSLGNRLEVGDLVCFVGTYGKRMETAKFLGLTKGGNFRVDHTCGHRYQVFKVVQPMITYAKYLATTGAPRNKASHEKWLELLADEEEVDAWYRKFTEGM